VECGSGGKLVRGDDDMRNGRGPNCGGCEQTAFLRPSWGVGGSCRLISGGAWGGYIGHVLGTAELEAAEMGALGFGRHLAGGGVSTTPSLFRVGASVPNPWSCLGKVFLGHFVRSFFFFFFFGATCLSALFGVLDAS
jgi:hypothetical protein